jgi:hypothetical protein
MKNLEKEVQLKPVAYLPGSGGCHLTALTGKKKIQNCAKSALFFYLTGKSTQDREFAPYDR